MTTTPIPVEALPPLYTAVGEIVINWGNADLAISRIVATIYQAAGGKHQSKEAPRAFNKRLTFLRRCVENIDRLGPFRADALAIIDSANHTARARNAMMHCALAAYEAKTATYSFISVDVEDRRQFHEARSFTRTLADLRAATILAQRLTAACFVFEDRLMQTFVR